MLINDVQSVNLDGVDYFTDLQIAALTGKSVRHVKDCHKKGNKIRKLKSRKINRAIFIPVTELFDFPFMIAGHKRQDPMGMGWIQRYYLEDGELKTKINLFSENEGLLEEAVILAREKMKEYREKVSPEDMPRQIKEELNLDPFIPEGTDPTKNKTEDLESENEKELQEVESI